MILELVGGQGSDTFNIGGGNNGLPITVVTNSLQGHSGLIAHIIESNDPAYNGIFAQGISANVADNDAPGVVVNLVQGPLRVFESPGAPSSLIVAQYTVVLSRAPEEDVSVTAAPVAMRESDRLAGGKSIALNGNEAGVTLIFNRSNWFTPQTVFVTALDDVARRGHAEA